jgi:hypothetical protein
VAVIQRAADLESSRRKKEYEGLALAIGGAVAKSLKPFMAALAGG